MTVYNIDQFLRKVKINGYTFGLTENTRRSTSASGITFLASSGPRLWQGQFSYGNKTHDDQREVNALVADVMNAGNYFIWTPWKERFPISDRNGAIISTASPKINNPKAGNEVSITGLPANFLVTQGDYFSFYHEAHGVHRLFQVKETKRATAAGNLTITMNTAFPSHMLPPNGVAIEFVNPKVTVRYVPQSAKAGAVSRSHTEGSSLSFIEAISVKG